MTDPTPDFDAGQEFNAGQEMKAVLWEYLADAREVLRWKLAGLGEYDVRRPLTPTGTNLLGLVKHLAGVELLYFGFVFGRPYDREVPWFGEHVEPNADMWATADESRAFILDTYEQVCAHADAAIGALDLTTAGHIPWWPAGRDRPSLGRLLVHVTTETHRHVGQADVVRELIDGAVGLRADADEFTLRITNDARRLPADQWNQHRRAVEAAAREAAG